MATINFPANPQLNDTYTFLGRTWIYNGIGWVVKPNDITAFVNKGGDTMSGKLTITSGGLSVSGTTSLEAIETSSQTLVDNLNADFLDGQEGAFYRNASNLNAGTLALLYGGTGATTAVDALTNLGGFPAVSFTGTNIANTLGTTAVTNATNSTLSNQLTSYGGITTTPGTGNLNYTYHINTGTAGLFPAPDNSNGILTLNRHDGNYDSQLGFSSDGNLYYRKFSNTALDTTTLWRTIWDSGNDGAGSGLDAGLFNGLGINNFLKKIDLYFAAEKNLNLYKYSFGSTNRGDQSEQLNTPTTYGMYLSLTDVSNQGLQLYGGNFSMGGAGTDLYFRTKSSPSNDFLTDWTVWKKIWDSSNFNPSAYLPLSGGPMTGSIYMGTKDLYFNSADSGDIVFSDSALNQTGRIWHDGISLKISGTSSTSTNLLSIAGSTFTYNNNTIWHAGNDSSIMRYRGWIGDPGYNANTMAGNTSGFTYANNAPYAGPIINFEAGGYNLELNTRYDLVSPLAFRARNGDSGVWQGWTYLATTGDLNNYLAKTGGTLTGALTVDLGAAAASPLALKSSGVTTTIGSLNGSWFHMGTTATNGFYFYQNVQSAGTMTATSFIGNASSATITHRLYRHDPESENTYYVSPFWTGNSNGWRIGAYNTNADEQANIHRVSVDQSDYAASAGALSNFTNQAGARYSTDFNTILTTGFFNADGTPTNCPSAYANLIVAKGIDTGLQIAGGYSSDALHFRGWHTSGATFTPWRSVIHSGNISTQSVASSGTATILKAVNVTSTSASTWNPQSLTYQAWGQKFVHTTISADSGDICYWLRPSQYAGGGTELCVVIDGDYYAGTGLNKVWHAGNLTNLNQLSNGPGYITSASSISGNAASVTITNDETTNTTRYVLFSSATSGSVSPRADSGFTYNPSTGALTATSFNGITGLNGTGSATTASKSDHTHSYLTLTGGALTGAVSIKGAANTFEYALRLAKENYADTGGHTTLIGFGVETVGWSKSAIGHTRTGSYDRGYLGFYINNSIDTTSATASDLKMSINSSGLVWSNGGFSKQGSSDSYVLLGAGGHKLISDFTGNDRNKGVNNVTTLTSLPISKRLVYATVTSATSLSLSSAMEIGDELHIVVYNSSASAVTQVLPNTGAFVSMSSSSILIPAAGYVEINIICHATGSYMIRAGGVSW